MRTACKPKNKFIIIFKPYLREIKSFRGCIPTKEDTDELEDGRVAFAMLMILHHQTRSRRGMDYHNNQHAVVYHQRLPPYFPPPPATLHLHPRPSPHQYYLSHALAHYSTVYYYYLLVIFSSRLDSDYNYLSHAYILYNYSSTKGLHPTLEAEMYLVGNQPLVVCFPKVCVGPHLGGRSVKIGLAVSSPVD